MKTVFELKFEKYVILSICEKDYDVQRRAEIFREFHKYSESYYEVLCEALFLLSSGEVRGDLFITPAGKAYVSYNAHNLEDRRVICGDELPPLRDDLYEQLHFFMRRFSCDENLYNSNKPQNIDFGITM